MPKEKSREEQAVELDELYRYGSSYKFKVFDFIIDLALDGLITFDEAVESYIGETEGCYEPDL